MGALFAAAARIMIVVGILLFIFATQIGTAKKESAAHTQRVQARNEARAKVRGGTGVGHDHITSTELTDQRKLDQLKALKEAGLLTQEEFNEAWQKVMDQAARGA